MRIAVLYCSAWWAIATTSLMLVLLTAGRLPGGDVPRDFDQQVGSTFSDENEKTGATNRAASEFEPSPPRRVVLLAAPASSSKRTGSQVAAAQLASRTSGLEQDWAGPLAAELRASNIAEQLVVEVVPADWPPTADAVHGVSTVFVSGQTTAVQTKRLMQAHRAGCGLVLVLADEAAEFSIDSLGTQLGLQRAAESVATEQLALKSQLLPRHALTRGVAPFDWKEQPTEGEGQAAWGWQLPADAQPIVVAEFSAEKGTPDAGKRTFAAAIERQTMGRALVLWSQAFHGPANAANSRTLLLNGLCWTAHLPVPAGGVGRQLGFDDQWTPLPHLGKEDLPKETEADWRDSRVPQIQTGPFFTASIVVPEPGKPPEQPKDDRTLPLDPNKVVKALAVRLGGGGSGLPRAGVLYDKESMVLRCGWKDGFLRQSERRFGLLEMPVIAGDVVWSTANDSRWQIAAGPEQTADFADVNSLQVRYKGLLLDGDRVILKYRIGRCELQESPVVEEVSGSPVFVREFQVGPHDRALRVPVGRWLGATPGPSTDGNTVFVCDREWIAVRLLSEPDSGVRLIARSQGEEASCVLEIPASDKPRHFALALWQGPAVEHEKFTEWVRIRRPDPSLVECERAFLPRWGKPITTIGTVGEPAPGSPFAVDTLSLPYDNRYGALMFASGFDFAADGTCYVCTAHGDVWKVTGIDSQLKQIVWQRFATGLYQPLGLKVRDDGIFVLGRDQVTRLHDWNDDGEADEYENFNDDLTDRGQSHAYAMCLETDAAGNFYFLKSGAPDTPHGGSLIQLAADGSQLKVFATGFRHPNGLSVSPDGTLTTADNEGNWVPATRIDLVEAGKFYGHVPTAHLDVAPEDPGRPLCWLPRSVDNSAGGQVWVPQGHWGPLSGQLLHLSFGQCTAMLILREQVNGVWQGGAVRLPVRPFLSGVCRGRFRTEGRRADPHLYVCGLNGWSSTAEQDGCLQRVKYVGGELPLPIAMHASVGAVELVFSQPLALAVANDLTRYTVEVWNYRWTRDYGSKDYSIADPARPGRDALPVTAVRVSADGCRVRLSVPDITATMQVRIQAGLRTAAGQSLPVDYYGTIHEFAAKE